MNTQGVWCALIVAGLAPAALAQWSDNFDSYPVGSINGQGGWQGWDGVPTAAGTVTDTLSLTAPHSQQINSTSDSVHQYSGVASGSWSYTAQQYIPANFTGQTYFILVNTYHDGGPYDWSVEMQFDSASGMILDDLRTGATPTPFVRGAWAEIRVDFDLSAGTMSQFYNGALFSSGAWTTGPTSVLNLAAVDLFGGTGTNVYYDNLSLVPAPAGLGLAGLAGLMAARRRRA